MDLDRVSGLHLRYFLCVVDEGSVAAAARVLRVSQPSLSQQISQLEGRLGMSLFERSAHGMRKTRAGSMLDDAARAWMSALRSITSTDRQPTAVGIPRASGPDVLEWVRGHVGGAIDFRPCTSAAAPAMVLDHRLDAAVVRAVPAAFTHRLTCVALPPQPLGLLVSVGTADQYGIGVGQPVSLDSLAGCRLLWFDEKRAPEHARKLRELLRQAGWEPDTYIFDPASDSLTLDALRNNLVLVALRPEPDETPLDLRWSPVTPTLAEEFSLITRA